MPEGMNWDVWCGTAEVLPFNKKFHPGDWRSWYVYGTGALGDWAPHILDTIHQFLDLGLPEEFSAVEIDGPNNFIFPMSSTLNFKFPARGEGKPAMDITWRDGVKNKTTLPPEMKGVSINAQAGKVIYSKNNIFYGGSHSDILRIAPDEKMKEMAATLPKFPFKNSNHHANFLLAVKGQEQTRSPFEVAAPLSQLLNLGVIAQRLGGSYKFDRATKQIVGNEKANAMLKGPPPRKGWEQYYKL
jgi:predicted dehydrogenase